MVIKMVDLGLMSDDDDETSLILASSTIIFSSCTLLCNGGLKKKASFCNTCAFEITCSFITNRPQPTALTTA